MILIFAIIWSYGSNLLNKENRKDQNGIFISKYGEFVFDEF